MSVQSFARKRITTMIVAVLAFGVIVIAGVGVANASRHHYPAAVVKAFQSSCVKAAKASASGKLTNRQISDYCRFTLQCIEGKESLKAFENNPTSKIVTNCEKVGIKKALK
jgi:hypothetical protein